MRSSWTSDSVRTPWIFQTFIEMPLFMYMCMTSRKPQGPCLVLISISAVGSAIFFGICCILIYFGLQRYSFMSYDGIGNMFIFFVLVGLVMNSKSSKKKSVNFWRFTWGIKLKLKCILSIACLIPFGKQQECPMWSPWVWKYPNSTIYFVAFAPQKRSLRPYTHCHPSCWYASPPSLLLC